MVEDTVVVMVEDMVGVMVGVIVTDMVESMVGFMDGEKVGDMVGDMVNISVLSFGAGVGALGKSVPVQVSRGSSPCT